MVRERSQWRSRARGPRGWGLAGLLFFAASASGCQQPGEVRVHYLWADGEPTDLPVYAFLRIEERPGDPRAASNRIRATAGPARYDGGRLRLEIEELLNGEDLVAVVEVRRFPSLDAPILYYGLSEPFRMGPNVKAEVPVSLHATATPRFPPREPGLRATSPFTATPHVRLMVVTDRGSAVRLSNDRSFPDDLAPTLPLVESASVAIPDGFSAWWVDWDLELGLAPCPTPGTCEREVFARAVDTLGYESVTHAERLILDTAPPQLRPESEIQPRAAGPGTRVKVTLVASEVLRRAPELVAEGAPELRFDRLLPEPDGPSNTYVYFSRPLGEHRPADGDYPLTAVLQDLAGNRSEPLEVGVLTLDGVDPDVRDLEVSPSRIGPNGLLHIAFRLAEDLPAEGIQVTLGGAAVAGCERSGRAPELRVACSHRMTGSEIQPGTQATLSVLVTAVDAALNRATLEAPVVVDFAPPDLRDLTFFPTPARLRTSASLRIAVSERLGEPPVLGWAGRDPGFRWERAGSSDFEHFFRLVVTGTTPPGAHELITVALADEVGNHRELRAGERLLPASFQVDVIAPRIEAFAVTPPRVGRHPGVPVAVRFTVVEDDLAQPPQVTLGSFDLSAACVEEARAAGRSTWSCSHVLRGDEVPAGAEVVLGVVVQAADRAGNTVTAGSSVLFDFAPPGLTGLELLPNPAGLQDVVLLRVTATEPLDAQAPALTWAGPAPAFVAAPASASAFERSWTLPVTASTPSGAHVLEAIELVDAAGNRAQVQAVAGLLPATLELDTVPPAILQLVAEAPGQPVATSPPRVGTISANRGVVVRFSVREQSPAGPPRVRVGSRDVSSGCSVVGANQPPLVAWRCAFTAAASDAPSGVETAISVVVEARDRAGNLASAAATVIYDLAAPTLRTVTVGPSPAGLGSTATLRVEASEALVAAPSLAWTGVAPPFVAQPTAGPSSAYVFQLGVSSALTSGTYVLAGVTLRDLAGNQVTATSGGGLPVSWLVDTTPPVVSAVNVVVPGSPVTTPPRVNGSPTRRVEVSFTVTEANPGAAPRVSLGAPLPPLPCTSAGAPPVVQWSCVHAVTGSETAAGTEAVRPILVEVEDAAGNRGSGSASVVFDFAPPQVVADSVSVTLTASAANPLQRVERVSFGTAVVVQASWSEPLRSAPTVRTRAPERIPFTLQESAGATYRHGYTLTRAAPLRQGLFQLEAVATDLAGNQATVPIPNSGFVVDTVRPPPLDVMTGGRVLIERTPWGSQATAGRSRLTVEGLAQAASGDAAVVLIANPFSLREAARADVRAGGAFGPVELDSTDLPTASVQTVDAAGNRSDRRTIRNGRWIATLGGKLPGSVYPNPHRLVKVGEARRMKLQAPEGGAEEEATLQEVTAASLLQGQSVRALATPSWIEIDEESPGPGARRGHAMAFDPVRGVLVVFGGHDGTRVLGDLWEWDGVRWRERTPSGPGPRAREHAAMIYDAAREQILLFGGDGPPLLRDLWRWDGSEWTELTDASTPSGRSRAAIGYHPPRGEVLLFGGRVGSSALNDTWIYDGTTWRQHLPSPGFTNNPSAREAAAMAHVGGVLVLFGGQQGSTYLGDTWEWNGTRWTLRVGLSPTPPARAGHGMASDPASGTLVLYGGRHLTSRLPDTWVWNGSAWAEQPAPFSIDAPLGRAAPLVYDARQDRFLAFGGEGQGTTIFDQLYAWDRQRWSLRYSPRSGPAPEARNGHILAADAHGPMMFGGGQGGEPAAELVPAHTWVWTGAHWTQAPHRLATPAPTARSRAAAARIQHPSLGDGVLMFGGRAGFTRNNQTWFWRRVSGGGEWHRLLPTTSPVARDGAAMAYDSRRNQLLLFGGHNASEIALSDLWIWTGSNWSQRTQGSCPSWPPGVAQHALSYDAVTDRVLLHGAGTGTWDWDGTCWTQRSGPVAIHPVIGISMSLDPGRGRVLLGPGARSNVSSLDDRLLAWSGAAWLDMTPRLRWLTGRAGAGMAHAAAHDRMVLFGGLSEYGDERTTFVLTSGREVRPGLLFEAYWIGAGVAQEDLRGLRLLARVGGSGERRLGTPPLAVVQHISGVSAQIWNPYWGTWDWAPPTLHSAPASAPGDLQLQVGDPSVVQRLSSPHTGYVTVLLTPRGPDYATTRAEIALDYVELAVDYCLECP